LRLLRKLSWLIIILSGFPGLAYPRDSIFTLPFKVDLSISCGFYGYKFESENWHSGTDFYTSDQSTGQHVVAALEGEVITVIDTFPNDGNYIKILHENGNEKIYTHLNANSIIVSKESIVEPGQLLGTKYYYNTEVLNDSKGEVVEVEKKIKYLGYGNYVKIKHEDGYETIYGL